MTETTARPFLPPPPATEPSFEVENLGRRAQPDPQQRLRRQQRDVAGKRRNPLSRTRPVQDPRPLPKETGTQKDDWLTPAQVLC